MTAGRRGGEAPTSACPKGPCRTNEAEQIRAAVLADLGLAPLQAGYSPRRSPRVPYVRC